MDLKDLPQLNSEWWWRTSPDGSGYPCKIKVLEYHPYSGFQSEDLLQDLGMLLVIDRHRRSGTNLASTEEWMVEEWEKAIRSRDVVPWPTQVTLKDLLSDETLCRVCHGTKWEQTTDLEILPCSACLELGKICKFNYNS